MIPKIIHYCWFGGNKKSKLINNCIASWKLHMPDYDIIEWNEDNCDLSSPFLQSCIELKKWAFISDYIRLKKLYEFGGVYLDTDMLVIKNLDLFLNDVCFIGAEDLKFVNASILGCIKGDVFVKRVLAEYENMDVITESTNLKAITIPRIILKTLEVIMDLSQVDFSKIQKFKNLVIYPSEYFYALPFNKRYDVKKYHEYIYPDTYAIHLWNASWIDYSEFHYLRVGEYKQGFFKMIKGNVKDKLNFKYFKKIMSSINQSFKK